jgi:uncharacterized protein YyaL (SSP411 family)
MNRLQHETSPYLLQHAHNPVDWYAWKPEAFERARAEDKPIVVSIGYSTCHWCHVMERESFEDPDTAAVMNELFVSIKVDREERPDVDAIYMEACQIMTGQGGWPLNCFLTPDGRPFYAGTYYPPRPAYGRPSWQQVLRHLSDAWQTQRDVVNEQADKLVEYIRRNDDVLIRAAAGQKAGGATAAGPAGSGASLTLSGSWQPTVEYANIELLETIYYSMREQFDRVEGGFGGAPKFPSAMALHFLLHYHAAAGSEEALEHALLSLDKMIDGGIYDQLGGGFARYATDREWLVPHFEKMLYDNALLVSVLADAVRLTGAERYRDTIEETLEFVLREMRHDDGGFFSALDADSEGEEGKFYVWSRDEVAALLGAEADLFAAFYDVSAAGNWEGHNILWRRQRYEDFAAANGLDAAEVSERLARSREMLLGARAGRVRPGLDDKVLLSWNALMTSAFAAAYPVLGNEAYREAAVENIAFLLAHLRAPDGRLLHTWKDGQAQYDAFLEDYAYFIAALLDTWEITYDYHYLAEAERYTEHVMRYFPDRETGLFYFTGEQQTDVLLRKKDLYDNATPSGNSTMALNLQRLGILLDRRDWREHAAVMLDRLRPTVERFGQSFARWALAMLREVHPAHEIAIIGGDAVDKALAVARHFLPHRVVAAALEPTDRLALLAGKPAADPALIYVCRNFACQQPVQTLEEFRALTGARIT